MIGAVDEKVLDGERSAVVAKKEDDGVVGDALVDDGVGDALEALVEDLDAAELFLALGERAGEGQHRRPQLELRHRVEHTAVRLEAGVGSGRGEVEVEGYGGIMVADELFGFVVE